MSFHLGPLWRDIATDALAHGWREQALPPEFARLEGESGDEPVTMEEESAPAPAPDAARPAPARRRRIYLPGGAESG